PAGSRRELGAMAIETAMGRSPRGDKNAFCLPRRGRQRTCPDRSFPFAPGAPASPVAQAQDPPGGGCLDGRLLQSAAGLRLEELTGSSKKQSPRDSLPRGLKENARLTTGPSSSSPSR